MFNTTKPKPTDVFSKALRAQVECDSRSLRAIAKAVGQGPAAGPATKAAQNAAQHTAETPCTDVKGTCSDSGKTPHLLENADTCTSVHNNKVPGAGVEPARPFLVTGF